MSLNSKRPFASKSMLNKFLGEERGHKKRFITVNLEVNKSAFLILYRWIYSCGMKNLPVLGPKGLVV